MATKSMQEMKPVLENEIIQFTEDIKKAQKKIKQLKKDLSQNKEMLATINRQLSHAKGEQNEV